MPRKKSSGKAEPGINASPEAKKTACAILEVLSGIRGPTEAAQELSITLPRYYVLEGRAVEGLVKAMEPRKRGKRSWCPETRILALEKECDGLKRELSRTRTLLRLARRATGLSEDSPAKKGRRKTNRARRVLSSLRKGKNGEKADADTGNSK
ncbi:MAG: hypothetical protein ACYTHN_21325 [Planctomycetota bacterium]|jgi:hypothetical protein